MTAQSPSNRLPATTSPSHLRPAAEQGRVVIALAGLFRAFAWRGPNAGEEAGILAEYAGGLEDFPVEAIEAACERFARGGVPEQSRDFPPSLPRLRDQVKVQVSAIAGRKRAAEAAGRDEDSRDNDPPPPTAEQVERASALVRDLKAAMTQPVDPGESRVRKLARELREGAAK